MKRFPQAMCVVLFALGFIPATSVAQQYWSSQTSPTSGTLYSVKAVSSTVAWASGEGGIVLRTTDGGDNWNTTTSPNAGLNCYSIEALDATTAWVVAVNSNGTQSVLYKTTNGGSSWVSRASSAAAGTFYNAVRFWDANNGIFTGDPENGEFVVYTTTNVGENWTRTDGGNIPNPFSGEVGLTDNLEILGSNAWFGTGNTGATTSTRVFRSTNRGQTWNASAVLSGLGASISSLGFVSSENGILLGLSGNVMQTRDAGATWTTLRATGLTSGHSLTAATPTSVIAVGSGTSSAAFASTDGGSTWSSRSTSPVTTLNAVSFANSFVGWAVGPSGVILKWIGGNLPGGALTEIEPNGSSTQAMSVSLGDSVNGSVSPVGDIDYYKFTASTSDTVEIYANAIGSSSLEVGIQLYDNSGTEIAGSSFFLTGNDARVLVPIQSAGTHFLRVTAVGTSGDFPNVKKSKGRFDDESVEGGSGAPLRKVADPTGAYRVRILSFTATAPIANSAGVVNIYSTAAIPVAYVFPNGLKTDVSVQYGLTASYGQSASAGTVEGLDAQFPFAVLTGLSPGTTYNYRIVASNAQGTSTGKNETFTTAAAPVGWSVQSSGTSNKLWGVYSVSANISTAVGEGGTIIRTTNGGANWTVQTSPNSESLWGVAFSDANTGLTVGTDGTILRTTNGGSTWTTQSSGTQRNLQSVAFPTSSIAVIVGNNGTVLRSTNGGVSWVSQNSSSTVALYGVAFIDANTGWAVGDAGTILKTTNGGSAWTLLNSGSNEPLYGVSFSDANNGTVVGDNGTILRTTNGGANWSNQTSQTQTRLWAVSFINAADGVIAGNNGLILRTTNGGGTWTVQSTGTFNEVTGISIGGTAATAVGDYGMVLRSSSVAATISLSSTNISFGTVLVGSSSQQTLTVTCPTTSPTALIVSSVSSNNAAYTASPTNFSLNPGGSQAVTITFTPTATGSAAGTITVTHNAANGSSGVAVSGTGDTHSGGLTTATGRFSSGIPPSAWVLMSVPYGLDNRAASALSSQLTGTDPWKIYVYSGGNTVDVTNASDAFQLTRGFWFKTTSKSSPFNLSYGGGTVVTTATHPVLIPTGWSIVGPPFYNNEASWTPVNTTPGSTGIRVWKYSHESNSWTGPLNPSTERMKPFGGYAVYNQTGSVATFTFSRGPATAGSVREWEEGDGWYVVLKVGNATMRVGEHRQAASGFDYYDYPMPPAPPDAAVEPSSLSGKLWSDIRPVDERAVERWKLAVYPSATQSIKVEEVFGIPPGWNIRAEGIPSVGMLTLEKGKEYHLPADVSIPFIMTVTAGPQEALEKETIPKSFSLSQNYPNPFNPVTVISYQLPVESWVNLSVHDMLGHEVMTLVKGYQKPGMYEVQWNGKNNDGAVVPSGIYFYSLQTGAFSKTRKMLLLK